MNELIKKYLEGKISKEEEISLYQWVKENNKNLSYFKNKVFEHELQQDDTTLFDEELSFEKLKRRIDQDDKQPRKFKLPQYYKYAAIFVLVFGLAFFLSDSNSLLNEQNSPATVVTKQEEPKNKITLKMADGSIKVFEDKEEEFSFLGQTFEKEVVKLNEIIVPRGEVFKIVLSDSTAVWLNAETKLEFPENFGKNSENRVVTLEGEAFFDVTHDEKRPFIVQTSSVNVNVLGTQFNVSSYNNHNIVQTTLVEGSVRVDDNTNSDNSMLIKPSEQAVFNKNSRWLDSKTVNTDYFTAWKEKRIVFQDMEFEDILEKIQRVYNVDIENNNASLDKERFTGEFDIEDIETIFKALSTSIDFEYEINENLITINN